MTDSTIHTRAMKVGLSISTWTARKYDRVVTEEIQIQKNADPDSGRFNKYLLGKNAEAFKNLHKIAQRARQDHYFQTLPWTDEGQRLLPTEQYFDYMKWYRGVQEEFNEALREFLKDYPMLKERAKAVLGKMYTEEDYPSVDQVRGKFGMDVTFLPLPATGDVRVDLPREQVEEIEKQVQDRIADATHTAMRDAYKRLGETVQHIHERLSDKEKIFRDSLIHNARDLCDILKRLNVTGDPELEELREQVERQLTIYEPGTIRMNEAVRNEVAQDAKKIMDAMRGMYG